MNSLAYAMGAGGTGAGGGGGFGAFVPLILMFAIFTFCLSGLSRKRQNSTRR